MKCHRDDVLKKAKKKQKNYFIMMSHPKSVPYIGVQSLSPRVKKMTINVRMDINNPVLILIQQQSPPLRIEPQQ